MFTVQSGMLAYCLNQQVSRSAVPLGYVSCKVVSEMAYYGSGGMLNLLIHSAYARHR